MFTYAPKMKFGSLGLMQYINYSSVKAADINDVDRNCNIKGSDKPTKNYHIYAVPLNSVEHLVAFSNFFQLHLTVGHAGWLLLSLAVFSEKGLMNPVSLQTDRI